MNNKKQSSVDKLWDDVKGWIPQGQYAGVREYYLEAKAMHKEEMIDAVNFGQNNHTVMVSQDLIIAEKYHNEKYGGNK